MNLSKKILSEANDSNYGKHSLYKAENGDDLGRAAGILVICNKTNRALIQNRSSFVDQPFTWGIPGGTLKKGEDFKEGALREFKEEIRMNITPNLIPAYIFKNSKIEFHNFIGIVENEFNPPVTWEADEYAWANYQELWEIEPKHFGLEALLEHSGELIDKYMLPYRDSSGQLVEKIINESLLIISRK